ncbi:YqcC family protein [Vibrio sp.]|nr:YqcC family protein [Vibrio sp.]
MQSNLVLLLQKLELSLKALQLWGTGSPEPEALSSIEPFSVDKLTPEEWLQWIFIPKCQQLLNDDLSLPAGFTMSPYFEEAWTSAPERQIIIDIVIQIEEECASC